MALAPALVLEGADKLESFSRGQPGTPRLLGPDGGRQSVALGERVGLAGRPSRLWRRPALGPPPLLTLGPSWWQAPHTRTCTRVRPSLVPEMTAVPAMWTLCSELGGPWLTCPCWVVPAGRGSLGLGPQDLEARGPQGLPRHPLFSWDPALHAPAVSGSVSQRLLDREARTASGVCFGPLSSGTPILPRLSLEAWSQDPVGAQRRGRVTPVAGFRGRSTRVSLCVPERVACAHTGRSGLEMDPQSLRALRARSPAEQQAWAAPGVCAERPGQSEGQGARGTSVLCRILGSLPRTGGRGPVGRCTLEEDHGLLCGRGSGASGSWVRPLMSPPSLPGQSPGAPAGSSPRGGVR